MSLDGLSQEELHKVYLSANAQSSEAGWMLVESIAALINKLCSEHTDNQEKLAELMSEMRLVIFKSLNQWNPESGALTNWATTIAKRKLPRIMDRYFGPTKVQGTRKSYNVRDSYEEDLDIVFAEDEIQAVYCSMAQYLSEEERQIVLLRINGASIAHITKKLKIGCKSRTTKIYNRAICKLRKILLDE